MELEGYNFNKEVTAEKKVIDAHNFLKDFIAKFENAKRGGIHDFIEIALFNMVNSAIKDIDFYLISGHKSVDAQQVMSIFTDACQKVLDGIKKNLDGMKRVNFK
jgi:hypothetical protein